MSRSTLAFALASSLVVAACSGSTATIGGSDDGGGGGGPDGGSGDGAPAPDGSPGGLCPANPPNSGDACTTSGLTCEYGGVGPHLLCATLASCNPSTGGKSQWFVSPPSKDCVSSPQQNPGACPNAFADVPTGSKCPGGVTSSCVYNEGMCGCVPCVSSPPNGTQQQEWACEAYPQPQGCPEPQPRIGSPCTQEGQTCGYGTICGVLGSLPTLGCQSGRWSPVPIAASCAIRTCGK